MISLSIIFRFFIHNPTVKTRLVRCRRIIVFNFDRRVHLRAIVDFLVLEVFNNNNLLSKAVVGFKLFYLRVSQSAQIYCNLSMFGVLVFVCFRSLGSAKYKSYLSNCKRSSFRFKAILRVAGRVICFEKLTSRYT